MCLILWLLSILFCWLKWKWKCNEVQHVYAIIIDSYNMWAIFPLSEFSLSVWCKCYWKTSGQNQPAIKGSVSFAEQFSKMFTSFEWTSGHSISQFSNWYLIYMNAFWIIHWPTIEYNVKGIPYISYFVYEPYRFNDWLLTSTDYHYSVEFSKQQPIFEYESNLNIVLCIFRYTRQ